MRPRTGAGSEISLPVFDLALGFCAGLAITFLNQPDQLFAVALGFLKFVIGQLAPMLAGIAFDLFPFDVIASFQSAVPIKRQTSGPVPQPERATAGLSGSDQQTIAGLSVD